MNPFRIIIIKNYYNDYLKFHKCLFNFYNDILL